MSRRREPEASAARRTHAPIFAALGDSTRLLLLGKLSRGDPRSITELAAKSDLTRQAITKHLRVLENAGLVFGQRRGRETVFTFTPSKLEKAKSYLERVSQQWDKTLASLKTFVESGPSE